MTPGFFFFLPSPKAPCPEVLAVAMLAAAFGWGSPRSVSVVLSRTSPQHQRRLCCSSRLVCSYCHQQGLSLKVSSPRPRGTMGHEKGQVVVVVVEGGGCGDAGVAARSMALARLQAFFVASGTVSVCRPLPGPSHCSPESFSGSAGSLLHGSMLNC